MYLEELASQLNLDLETKQKAEEYIRKMKEVDEKVNCENGKINKLLGISPCGNLCG